MYGDPRDPHVLTHTFPTRRSSELMREASYDVIDFLQYAWLRVAQFYPDNLWGPKTAEEYIGSYIQDRFSFHWSKHDPSGPGTGGTIVGVLTGGDEIGRAHV